MVSNQINLNTINRYQKAQVPFGSTTKPNIASTPAKQVTDEGPTDSFASTIKSGLSAAALFEGIPFINLLRKNKKLEGKIYSDGMKQLQQTLDAAKQQLFKGEGKLTTRIKDYLGVVDKNQKAYSDLRSEVAKRFKEVKKPTKVATEVAEEVAEEAVKKAPSKLTGATAALKKPFEKAGAAIAKKFPQLAKVGGKFSKLMKTSGAGMMLVFSGISEMMTEVIPTFKELGPKQGFKQLAKSFVRIVGDTAGYILGAKAGAAIGTAICPGIGTVVGSVVGFVGGMLGSFVAGKITEKITGPTERELAQKQQEQIAAENNPFERQDRLYSTTA